MGVAMTKPMVIVTSFTTRYNIEKKYLEVISAEESRCPYCGSALCYRNSRLRGLLDELQEKAVYLLRRLWCECCRHLHTEIPAIIQPYRRYASCVIQDVLEGGDTCTADDSTIRRWRNDFKEAKADIEQRLRSAYVHETGAHAPVTKGTVTLDALIKREPRWLSFVMKLLICHGHRLCTRFAFCPREEAVKIARTDKPGGKGGAFYDKSKEDTG